MGGVSPYLTLFSRAGISREQADADAAKLKIYELPSARGCTYVLPASDFALGLAAGQGFDSDMKAAVKLGVTEKEIAKLCDAVTGALEKGPLGTEELRQATYVAESCWTPSFLEQGLERLAAGLRKVPQRRGIITGQKVISIHHWLPEASRARLSAVEA